MCDGADQHNEVQTEGKVKLNHATQDTHFTPLPPQTTLILLYVSNVGFYRKYYCRSLY